MGKKYCIFAAQYLPHVGGIERYNYNLSKKLIERGNEVIIVTSNVEHIKVYEKIDGASVYRLPCFNLLGGRCPVIKMDRQFRKIHRYLMKQQFDMVIVNARFYFHSLYGMYLSRKQKAKCITIDHGTSHMLTGNALLDKIGELYEHTLTFFEKQLCQDFYGVSGEVNRWLEHFHIHARGTLYNSIDLQEIQEICEHPHISFREIYNIPKETTVIVYAGRLVKEKGIMQLVSVVERLHVENEKVCLFIAGDGEMMQEVQAHESSYIIPLGRLEHEDVIALMHESDIYCLPTMYPEGFPTATLEAIACHCYPVVTDKGGVRELLPDAAYGCVLPDNKKRRLYSAVKKKMHNKEACEQALEKAYERVSERFTWETTAEQVEKICGEKDAQEFV